jgi:hypothetical protein
MNKDGESKERPAGPLERALSKVVGALVILCIILVLSYALLAFDGESIKTEDQKISDSLRAAENTQRRHLAQVESLQKEANRLLKRANNGDFDRGNCTSCDGRFVTEAYFDSNVTALETTIAAVNESLEAQIDGIQDEIDGFLINLNRTISNCSDCLLRTTLNAFQAEAEGQIAALSNYSLLSTNNYAKAYGAFGPSEPYGNVSGLWIMSPNVFCDDAGEIVLDQLQSVSLAFKRVQIPGRCPNGTASNGPLMYRKPNGPITFCPCETGLYSIGVNVGNLNTWVTTPEKIPFLPFERGSYISLGLVYSPPGGTAPLLFDSNPFPLMPIISYTNSLLNVSLPEIPTDVIPIVNLYEFSRVAPFSKVSTGMRWLNRTVGDDENACYDFVMNVDDPFLPPEHMCYNNGTSQVDHTFFYPGAPKGTTGALRFIASLTVQRVAWKEGGLVP